MNSKKKIGIACGCRKLNYGSILQSYALCTVIKEAGYECNFVWVDGNLFKHYNIRLEKIAGVALNAIKHPTIFPKVIKSVKRVFGKKSHYSISSGSRQLFEQFVKQMDISLYKKRELRMIEKTYYKFVCGSDQIWNSFEYFLDPMYFLRFTSKGKRVAYAPSFGTSDISYYNRSTIKRYLSEFGHISVREESGKEICKELIHKNVPVVLDPTLLISANHWKELLTLDELHEKYCFVYFLNQPSKSAISTIAEIRKKMRIIALPINYDCFNENELVEAGPKEFLEYLMNAKYVLTDSFHGTIFSINFNKQFLTFNRHYSTQTTQSTRISGILERLELEDRFVQSENEKTLNKLIDEIPYDKVNRRLESLRQDSKAYLSNALK